MTQQYTVFGWSEPAGSHLNAYGTYEASGKEEAARQAIQENVYNGDKMTIRKRNAQVGPNESGLLVIPSNEVTSYSFDKH